MDLTRVDVSTRMRYQLEVRGGTVREHLGTIMANPRGQRRFRSDEDLASCPACGVAIDPGAYRCPRCRIYFCFTCRRRVQARDEQFQCANPQCDGYGKLLCVACAVPQSSRTSPAKGSPSLGTLLTFLGLSTLGGWITHQGGFSPWSGLIMGAFVAMFVVSSVSESKEAALRIPRCTACNEPAERLTR